MDAMFLKFNYPWIIEETDQDLRSIGKEDNLYFMEVRQLSWLFPWLRKVLHNTCSLKCNYATLQ